MPKAWRDPCVRCASAAFMLCIVHETMDVQKVRVQIKLKVHAKEKPCVSSDASFGSSSESLSPSFSALCK